MLVIIFCLLSLILLVSWVKLNPFLAFLLLAVSGGLMLGIPSDKIMASVQKGMGDTLGSIAIIICLGAMLGKLVAVSGAAQKIADVLVKLSGKENLPWALVLTGFLIGIPLFYNVGFVLVVPLIFSIAYQYKIPAVSIGIPMLASLSVLHGFLPPHPSPTALVVLFKANIGLTLLYGLAAAVPAIIIAGPLFAKTLKLINAQPLAAFRADVLPAEALPGAYNSFFTVILPVVLLMLTSIIPYLDTVPPALKSIFTFIGDPAIVMLVALAAATYTLGLAQGKSMLHLGTIYTDAVKDVAAILLIIGGSGAFKQVLTDSGINIQIAGQLQNFNLHPLVLGWLIAAVIRASLGSATVAGLTAAGIVSSLVLQNQVNPNLMVLAIGAGSLAFSHVNDSGFWMFKEYFNLSIKDTLRSWSVMETIIAVTGLGAVMLLNLVVS